MSNARISRKHRKAIERELQQRGFFASRLGAKASREQAGQALAGLLRVLAERED